MRRIILLILMIGVVIGALYRFSGATGKTVRDSSGKETAYQSKAAMVDEINRQLVKIRRIEQDSGETVMGCRVYSPSETAALLNLYQAVKWRLDLLNRGKAASRSDTWNDYQLERGTNLVAYQPQAVEPVLTALKGRVPEQVLAGYHIYLSPDAVSGVSGSGGAGYSIIYALPEQYQPDEDSLRVTLYHELGHHLHFSYIPESINGGGALWREYHQIRGGSWTGAGQANTAAWGKSSEETFAEDFRILFGDNQPYFNDLALGDPRAKPEKAARLRSFMLKLMGGAKVKTYVSPWIPKEGLSFWLRQAEFIELQWLLLAVLLGGASRLTDRRSGSYKHGNEGAYTA